MNDCIHCPAENECFYPYKPTQCVHQRKFWDREKCEEIIASNEGEFIAESAKKMLEDKPQ